MEKEYKVFVINPGSTSTKIALFINDKKIYQQNVDHDSNMLKALGEIPNQLSFRLECIEKAIEEADLDLSNLDAIASRCGGLVSLEGGVYSVNDKLLEHTRCMYTVKHPNTLGPSIALELQKKYGGKLFCVNPPDVDELDDVERICGFHEFFRQSKGHPLNQKENCIRYASSIGKKYNELNLICCHLGGGVTIAAHRKGRYCCVNDAVNGDGPMAPTRSGWLPAVDVVKMCFSGKYTEAQMYDRITRTGGFVDHLGTSDLREVHKMIDSGDDYALLIYNAFIYQIAKAVGGCAAALKGKVDAIILTGGISNDSDLTGKLSGYIDWIAPVVIQAGEFEMEGLASGAIRALKGEEEVREYTGIPVWKGFVNSKRND